MNNRSKNILYTLLLLTAVFVIYLYRSSQAVSIVTIEGATMGTTYHITYFDEYKRDFKPQIDSLLSVFNQSLNTYLPNSEISHFNTGLSLKFDLPYFLPVLERSKEISEASGGAFDPTIMPLVNAWGFGPAPQTNPDSVQVDSIKDFIGFEKIIFNKDSLWKNDPRTQLDFSAIAKGYGVDVVAEFISSKGVSNLLVEIGGEVVVRGKNLKSSDAWKLGILDPASTPDAGKLYAYISLRDAGMATSGNYFNYHEVNGKKVSHTIDPKSGYPIQRNLLSATVVAKDCMTADAWATAFMVLGFEDAKRLIEEREDLEGFLIYSADDGTIQSYSSENLVSKKVN